MRITLTLFLILFLGTSSLRGQQNTEEERYVRLIKANTAEMYQNESRNVRRITGPAQFLHNNTLIICDTAIWDVSQNTVDAIGNVKIIQNNTSLSGDRIHYVADSSLAKVRGHIVELMDRDSNRLRTYYLDYNTKDSVAWFYDGGSLVDKKGNIIESIYGYYDSKIERFKFIKNVEMMSDSLVLKSDSLAYYSAQNRAEFLGNTTIWQGDSYLSSGIGWYERGEERYNFEKSAFMMDTEKEVWAERIFYDGRQQIAELENNVQVLDTTQSALMFADYARYTRYPSRVSLSKNPSVAFYSYENNVADTLFIGADTMVLNSVPRYLVDSATVAQSLKRSEEIRVDPIAAMKNASKPASKPAEIQNRQSEQPPIDTVKAIVSDSTSKARVLPDSLILIRDSVYLKDSVTIKDSLTLKDSAQTEKIISTTDTIPKQDSTEIRFILADKNVKYHRSNIQGKCDSLVFNSLDSLIRMFGNPVMWNDRNQFTSDSIRIVTENKKLKKVEFLSNAFAIAREDSVHFNQIKGTDFIAFFNDGNLSRFDAYGGVNVLVFIAEDSILTTMNHKECNTMTSKIVNQNFENGRYIGNPKNVMYPLFDLEPEKKRLKGFNLRDNERPKDRFEVCNRVIRKSQREEALLVSLPSFAQTSRFFKLTPQIPEVIIKSREPKPAEDLNINAEESEITADENTAEKESEVKTKNPAS